MFKLRTNTLFILVVLAALLGTSYASASPGAAPTVGQPMVKVQVFPISNMGRGPFSYPYAKIGNMATFNVLNPNSVVELTFNGRISAGTSGYSAIFELRVDDSTSTYGIARAIVEAGEDGKYIPVSITGIFTNLSLGSHTASMWVGNILGDFSGAMINPTNESSDHLVVKEYLPFGYAYMPIVQK